ncbi:MAG: hypothetical protein JWM90_1725 [Thermoleophilia bacterium]|nr:hypothetical protein [Thermoleophilia bacterium]
MAERRSLPNIEALNQARAARPWWRRAPGWVAIAGTALTTFCVVAIWSAASTVWTWHRDSSAPAWLHGAIAASILLGSTLTLLLVWRREGINLVPATSLILCVVAWLVLCAVGLTT